MSEIIVETEAICVKGTNKCCAIVPLALVHSDTLVLNNVSSSISHRRFEEVNWPRLKK